MKDLDFFNHFKFFSYLLWIIPIIMVLSAITVVAFDDFNIPVSDSMRDLGAINLGMGAGVLMFRGFCIMIKDLTNTNSSEKKQ